MPVAQPSPQITLLPAAHWFVADSPNSNARCFLVGERAGTHRSVKDLASVSQVAKALARSNPDLQVNILVEAKLKNSAARATRDEQSANDFDGLEQHREDAIILGLAHQQRSLQKAGIERDAATTTSDKIIVHLIQEAGKDLPDNLSVSFVDSRSEMLRSRLATMDKIQNLAKPHAFLRPAIQQLSEITRSMSLLKLSAKLTKPELASEMLRDCISVEMVARMLNSAPENQKQVVFIVADYFRTLQIARLLEQGAWRPLCNVLNRSSSVPLTLQNGAANLLPAAEPSFESSGAQATLREIREFTDKACSYLAPSASHILAAQYNTCKPQRDRDFILRRIVLPKTISELPRATKLNYAGYLDNPNIACIVCLDTHATPRWWRPRPGLVDVAQHELLASKTGSRTSKTRKKQQYLKELRATPHPGVAALLPYMEKHLGLEWLYLMHVALMQVPEPHRQQCVFLFNVAGMQDYQDSFKSFAKVLNDKNLNARLAQQLGDARNRVLANIPGLT